MARGDKDRYSSRDERGNSRERGDRGYGGGGGGRDRKDDRGRDRERERDRDRESGRKRGRHDRESSRERGAKDRDGGGSKRKVRRVCAVASFVCFTNTRSGVAAKWAVRL